MACQAGACRQFTIPQTVWVTGSIVEFTVTVSLAVPGGPGTAEKARVCVVAGNSGPDGSQARFTVTPVSGVWRTPQLCMSTESQRTYLSSRDVFSNFGKKSVMTCNACRRNARKAKNGKLPGWLSLRLSFAKKRLRLQRLSNNCYPVAATIFRYPMGDLKLDFQLAQWGDTQFRGEGGAVDSSFLIHHFFCMFSFFRFDCKPQK